MSDVAIRVDNLSKKYRIGGPQKVGSALLTEAVIDTLKSPLRGLRRLGQHPQPEEYIWALRDVSFEVRHGEVVGIIGRNGAGKSTLLKILSRITEPTQGRVEIYGRVGSLLEVGTGFHSELTGRENVYLNGTILGMRRTEIDRKFNEIVEFAGVEQFIDTPVKRYSSGLQVRLAFAVAAHLEPEILVVDEVLSVGDLAFQKKCLTKMEGAASTGRTVLFVSHQMGQIAALCPRCLLIAKGQIVRDGPTNEVIDDYVSSIMDMQSTNLRTRADREGTGIVRFVDFWIEDERGNKIDHVLSGNPVKMVVRYEAEGHKLLRNVNCALGLNNAYGVWVTSLSNDLVGRSLELKPGEGQIECLIPKLPLNSGRFSCNAMLRSGHSGFEVFDYVQNIYSFTVEPGDYYGSGIVPTGPIITLIDHDWKVTNSSANT